jgi:hypothetical protein
VFPPWWGGEDYVDFFGIGGAGPGGFCRAGGENGRSWRSCNLHINCACKDNYDCACKDNYDCVWDI